MILSSCLKRSCGLEEKAHFLKFSSFSSFLFFFFPPFESLLWENTELTKDLGTILVGEEAVCEGLIDEVGGIAKALAKLKDLIREKHDE